MPNLFSYFIAFSITLAGILLLKPLAIRLGLVDEPGGRKAHEGNVPLTGGIAMFLGFSFALLTLDISLSQFRCLIAGSALLVATGLLDDFHELTPRSRLFIQIFVGVLMVWWGKNSLLSFGNILGFGDIKLGYFAFPITVLAVVAVINAVNMTDGVDGLAGSIVFVELFYLSWLCHHAQLMPDKQIINLLLGVLLAFLCFNFPFREKANVFMGDTGSMMLGFVLAWYCVYLSQAPHAAARPVTLLWIIAIPLWDISSVVLRRLLRGSSPFKADRGHLHHYLLARGFSSLQVNILIAGSATVVGFVGLLGEKFHVAEIIMFLGFMFLFGIYFLSLRYFFKHA